MGKTAESFCLSTGAVVSPGGCLNGVVLGGALATNPRRESLCESLCRKPQSFAYIRMQPKEPKRGAKDGGLRLLPSCVTNKFFLLPLGVARALRRFFPLFPCSCHTQGNASPEGPIEQPAGAQGLLGASTAAGAAAIVGELGVPSSLLLLFASGVGWVWGLCVEY